MVVVVVVVVVVGWLVGWLVGWCFCCCSCCVFVCFGVVVVGFLLLLFFVGLFVVVVWGDRGRLQVFV